MTLNSMQSPARVRVGRRRVKQLESGEIVYLDDEIDWGEWSDELGVEESSLWRKLMGLSVSPSSNTKKAGGS